MSLQEQQYHPKNILVTGGAGFIGSNFIGYLLKKNPDVSIINLDKLTYAGSLENLKDIKNKKRHFFVKGDINDARLVKQLLTEHHIDTIVHFAAESHVDRSIVNPAAFIETNVMGTFNLLETAKTYWQSVNLLKTKKCRFHHISTDEVYGTLGPQDDLFTEMTPYAPRSPYSASKAASDHLVQSYFHTYALPISMSNCSNNYGPKQHAEKLIPTIIHACANQKPIPIYGDGSNIRDWLYVEDHCSAIDCIIRKGALGKNYNVGADNEWSNIDLAKYIAGLMNVRKPTTLSYEHLIVSVPDRPGHDWRYAINSDRLKKELGWKVEFTFAEGMESTLSYYLHEKDECLNVT